MEQPGANDMVWLAVTVQQPPDFDRMNDKRLTVDVPVLACMTRRREAERGSGHSPTDPIDPQLIENRYRSIPPLDGTAPASLWLSLHERPLASIDTNIAARAWRPSV
jgi:hypothetical protein